MSKIGNYNFGEIEKRDDLIQKLIQVLKMAKTNLQITSGVIRDGQKGWDGDFLMRRIDEVLNKAH